MTSQTPSLQVDYKPRFPAGYSPGIGIIGCGHIVKSAHLPAYQRYGLRVIGAHDVDPAATQGIQERFGVGQVFGSLDELLAHPEIEVVDIATHPAQRLPLIYQALRAGKHVLSQKPFALDLDEARKVVAEADQRGLKLAVNQNGRWAPPWRVATLLIQQGSIGDVVSITHLYDMEFDWIPGTTFDDIPHMVIYDYSVHWIDICRCWLDHKIVDTVRARDYRTPNQPPHGKTPWGMWLEIACRDGSSALIRSAGCSATRRRGHPFWIHGTAGTIRGSVLGSDFVELEKDGISSCYDLEGQWFPDGFAGSMGELLCAIAEDRDPFNAARHNLLSLEMTLAACRSADQDAVPVAISERA